MIHVHGPRVLVALPPAESNETTTASGLVLVRDPDLAKIPTRGIVVQVGTKPSAVDLDEVLACVMEQPVGLIDREDLRGDLKRLGPAGFDVQTGDCVLFPLAAGNEVSYDGVDYVLLHESEILAVVEPIQEESVA